VDKCKIGRKIGRKPKGDTSSRDQRKLEKIPGQNKKKVINVFKKKIRCKKYKTKRQNGEFALPKQLLDRM